MRIPAPFRRYRFRSWPTSDVEAARCIQFPCPRFPEADILFADRHLPPVLEPAREVRVLALMLILADPLWQTTDPVQFIFAFNRDVSPSSA